LGEVRAAIRKKHGFDLKPQGGLVPLGANPKTGYFEFYELRSAWDGEADPGSIAIPVHDADGRIEVKDETGIVFVLLPGGTFTMGAQRGHAWSPNYEPGARTDEVVHEVTLAPFFLARHELTQAQYVRFTGERNPSHFMAGGDPATLRPPVGWTHPVENLDWDMAQRALQPHGLALPTEAQWEYGCRAGTVSEWYSGSQPSDLRGHARLNEDALGGDELQGKWPAHWPVGTGAANPFGLLDVYGNVSEWTRDETGDYGTERPGDGLRLMSDGSGFRVARGGCFDDPSRIARSAFRIRFAPRIRSRGLGLRAARTLGD
jgi:formylglycine-generating enzyme required for sulfatase activity